MKFREHRGGFEESLKTLVELKDFDALIQHVRRLLEPFPAAPPVTPDTLAIAPYGYYDDRAGWGDTYIVILKGYGPIGFTDSDE